MNDKISKVLEFINAAPRTEKEIKTFIEQSFSLSKLGQSKIFESLYQYDLVTYDDNDRLQLNYTLWYYPKKTVFVPNRRTKRAITKVRKMTGTYKDCEKKRDELTVRLSVNKERFIIE